MKKSVWTLIVLIFASHFEIYAQVTDTLAYLKSIETNKEKYIGKSFSYLKKSLVLTISVFDPVADKVFDMTAETSTHFWIRKPIHDDDFATFPILQIYWQTEFDMRKSDCLWRLNNGGYWSAKVDSLYGSRIIKDIRVF